MQFQSICTAADVKIKAHAAAVLAQAVPELQLLPVSPTNYHIDPLLLLRPTIDSLY